MKDNRAFPYIGTLAVAALALLVVTGCGGGGDSATIATAGSPIAGVPPAPTVSSGSSGSSSTPAPVVTSNDTLGGETDYDPVIVRSVIQTAQVVPEASPRSIATNKNNAMHYGYPRSYALIDINGDGLDDIFVAPTLFDQKPDLPIEIWLNLGDGRFANRTSDWVSGPIPRTSNPVAVLVADFNGDGKPDVFISDYGHESCTTDRCPGASNLLLLSDTSGRLSNASSQLDNNLPRLNHVISSVGDVNGDGLADIALTNFGDIAVTGDGVILQLNQGRGIFKDRTETMLNDEIGWRAYSYKFAGNRPASYDVQGVGAVAVADVDGDGKTELITCSYTAPDWYSKNKTIRFHRFDSARGALVEAGRYVLSGPLNSIVTSSPSFTASDSGTVGCAGVLVTDLDKDGKPDLLVNWERWTDGYLQVLKGKGNFQFEDVTLAATGKYETNLTFGQFTFTSLGYVAKDINGDGYPDIISLVGGATSERLSEGYPGVLINDGKGAFRPQRIRLTNKTPSSSEVNAALGASGLAHNVFFGRFLPRTDGRKALDMLLVDLASNLSPQPLPQEQSVTLRVLRAR